MQEPRYMLDKDSICYGCEFYKNWTVSDDPNYWLSHDDDVDENGGVCDAVEPCFAGSLNKYHSAQHGEWVDNNTGNHDPRDRWVKCSLCGYSTTDRFSKEYKYCPNCGAKMDLKD